MKNKFSFLIHLIICEGDVNAWSYEKQFHPYTIPDGATVIPALDYVFWCVEIAIELHKDQWKLLYGLQKNVQVNRIINRLENIQNTHFKEDVRDLFKNNLTIVKEHLQDLNNTCS